MQTNLLASLFSPCEWPRLRLQREPNGCDRRNWPVSSGFVRSFATSTCTTKNLLSLKADTSVVSTANWAPWKNERPSATIFQTAIVGMKTGQFHVLHTHVQRHPGTPLHDEYGRPRFPLRITNCSEVATKI